MRTDRSGPAPSLSGPARVWLLTGWLGIGCVALLGGPIANLSPVPAPFRIPWWALALGFMAAETFVVHLDLRRETHTFSLSEIPLLIGLFFSGPAELVAARTIGSGLALFAHRRQSPVKLAFNLAHFALEGAVAVVVFRAIAGGATLGPTPWLGALLAALVVDVLASLTITAAIRLSSGGGSGPVLGLGTVGAMANSVLGLVAVTILWRDPAASWLLLASSATVLAGYRGYVALQQRQRSLEQLHDSTALARSATAEVLVVDLLRSAREMFGARCAQIVLSTVDERPAAWTRMDESGVTSGDPPPEVGALVAALEASQRALLVRRRVQPTGADRSLAALGARDGVAAAMHAEGRTVGAMILTDRLGEVTTFDHEDLRLFETLVNHATVTIENAQLIERLRRQVRQNQHMALHDALTGLPNRALFRTRARQAIAAAPSGVAVMVVDLNRFKEVNDTLGHHTGDILLRAVADRLSAVVGERGSLARLGGDEFAVVVSDDPALRAPEELAATIVRALGETFTIGDVPLEVGASVGLARFPEDGTDPDTLLQRADVAMYLAKEDGTGWEVYEAARDRYTAARLAMIGDLRRAIEQGSLSVAYQPKVDLADDRFVGVEALVRWVDADGVRARPDEFIPLAEHTGLIGPLTHGVLREAIAQQRAWQRRGLDLSVAVNLSARTLRDTGLPDLISALLAEHGVRPDRLVLELTESSLMADPGRAHEVIARLDAMGIALSIDDFGTGYSSLAYLKRLPVRELKIDRSFVMGMLEHEEDAVIVRSTIDLGRNLGLRVVGEGVESDRLVEALRALGCDHAQGYEIGEPMPGGRIPVWAAERARRTRSADEWVGVG